MEASLEIRFTTGVARAGVEGPSTIYRKITSAEMRCFSEGQTAALGPGDQRQPASPEGTFVTPPPTSAKRSRVLRLRLGLSLGIDEFNGSPPLRMTKLLDYAL